MTRNAGGVIMKKHSIGFVALVIIAISAPVFAAVEDYAGTYSGTYSGTDSGTWTAKLDSEGSGFAFSWSSVFNEPDVGSGIANSSGEFVASMNGGAILDGVIDSGGNVQGTWNNSLAGHHGTLTGSRNAAVDLEALAGTYSGTYSGTDSGTWTAQLDGQGNVTGNSWSDVYNQGDSGSGIANSSGEFVASMNGGAILYGGIDSEGHVQGLWYNPVTDDGGSMSGSREVASSPGGGGGGGGGG
jgi:hypothetical protein